MKYKLMDKEEYRKLAAQILDYYNMAVTEFIKAVNGTKQMDYRYSDGIPDIMPAYAHDVANYFARYGGGNYQIQFILNFNGKLDFEKLVKAVRLSLDEEPVFGCRLVPENPPYWKRLENIDNVQFCTYEETDSPDQAVDDFLQSPMDMDNDPMVMVKLIRTQEKDILGIKINHACCDGAGAKEYLGLLERIYSTLEKEGDYKPVPRVRDRKDHYRALKTLGIKYPVLDMSIVEYPMTVWPFYWKGRWRKDITPFVSVSLPQGRLDTLLKFARERNVTVNDLILTAFYRSMFRVTNAPYGIPMYMGVTLDLRRYLPENKADAIRNFSGGIVINIPRIHGEAFEDTLKRISFIMKARKKMKPGYQIITGAEKAELLNICCMLSMMKFQSAMAELMQNGYNFCLPGLSNVGYISKSPIIFGGVEAPEAYIYPPVVRPPAMLLVASSYNGVLSFAMGYYKGAVKEQLIRRILDGIKDELMCVGA